MIRHYWKSLLSGLKIARTLKTKKFCPRAHTKETKKNLFNQIFFLVFVPARVCAWAKILKYLMSFK